MQEKPATIIQLLHEYSRYSKPRTYNITFCVNLGRSITGNLPLEKVLQIGPSTDPAYQQYIPALRPAPHSSAIDLNHSTQLVTITDFMLVEGVEK